MEKEKGGSGRCTRIGGGGEKKEQLFKRSKKTLRALPIEEEQEGEERKTQ